MRFGVFYELQLPKPWKPGDEHRLFHPFAQSKGFLAKAEG
jgi:hypothetical protein